MTLPVAAKIAFKTPVDQIVRVRRSTRSFAATSIPTPIVCELSLAAQSLSEGLGGEAARFVVLQRSESELTSSRPIFFGLIRSPRLFLVGAIRRSETAFQSYGYLLEHLVLKATDLGLGTCWLGYFDPSHLGDFRPGPDEVVPAIVAAGAMGRNSALHDRLIRSLVRASHRRGWSELFFNGRIGEPLTQEQALAYAEPLEMVRLAPSSGNTQPWRVVRDASTGEFHFFLEPVSGRYDRLHLHDVDLGIALCHFELSSREQGLSGHWVRIKDISVPAGLRYGFTWQPDRQSAMPRLRAGQEA